MIATNQCPDAEEGYVKIVTHILRHFGASVQIRTGSGSNFKDFHVCVFTAVVVA